MSAKTQIDFKVAMELKMQLKVVSKITKVFVREMAIALANEGRLEIENLGTFRIAEFQKLTKNLTNRRLKKGERAGITKEVCVHHKVWFSKSTALRSIIKNRRRIAWRTTRAKTKLA